MVQNTNSSPPSGSDNTHYNTPSTNVTVLSPDAVVNGGRAAAPAPKLNLRTVHSTAQLDNASGVHAGHGLNVPSAADSVTLSPTATEFTPKVSTADRTPVPASQGRSQALTVHNVGPHTTPFLVVIDDVARNPDAVLGPHVAVNIGRFSDEENISRIIEIYDESAVAPAAVANAFPVATFTSLEQIDSSEMHRGIHRVVFNDIREARRAYIDAFYHSFATSQLVFLPPKLLAIAHGENPALVSNHAGQVLVTFAPRDNAQITLGQVYALLRGFGEVYALQSVDSNIPGVLTFRVEFDDVRHAAFANQVALRDYAEAVVRFVPYAPDARRAATPVTTVERPSFTGRSTIPQDRMAEIQAMLARIVLDPMAPSRGFGRPGHNQVDVRRIQGGADVRTTIMLRNIPNKVTQADLKNYLDHTSFGAYDFMYLRIDFANNCNVGYAFINFIDPLAIIPFARRRAGAKWNIHDSNKIAEISYATIQGRDCLVQKFRNSSVMLEHPSYRPKLYFAGVHPLAGQEEHFPGPDNFSKMRRSIENAEHIGLFTPRQGYQPRTFRPYFAPYQGRVANTAILPILAPAIETTHHNNDFGHLLTAPHLNPGLFAPREGQQHREEQRRRRSQFDRGTPGAEYEAQMRAAHVFGSDNY